MNQQVTTDTTIFDQFVLVDIDFSSYSGLISLERTSLHKSSLPKDLASSGELKLVAPDTLKRFGTYRAAARNLCLKYGTKYLSCYAVPVSKWQETKTALAELIQKFEDEAREFVAAYPRLVQEWANQHPNEAEAIMKSSHTQEWLTGRFKAQYGASFLQPAPGMEEETIAGVKGMVENILGDIALAARQALRGHEKGSEITRRMVTGTLNNICEKLEALSFVDTSLQPIADAIKDHVDFLNLPKTGKLPVELQSRLAMLLMLMRDEDNLPMLADLLSAEQDKIKKVEAVVVEPIQQAEPLDQPQPTATEIFQLPDTMQPMMAPELDTPDFSDYEEEELMLL